MIENGATMLAVSAALFAAKGEQAIAKEPVRIAPTSGQLADRVIEADKDASSTLAYIERKLPHGQLLNVMVQYEETQPGNKPKARDIQSMYVQVDRPHPCKPSVDVPVLYMSFDQTEKAGQWDVRRDKTLRANGAMIYEHTRSLNGEWSEQYLLNPSAQKEKSHRTESSQPTDARRLLQRFNSQVGRLLDGHAVVMPQKLKADFKDIACDDTKRRSSPSEKTVRPEAASMPGLISAILAEGSYPMDGSGIVSIEKQLPQGQTAEVTLELNEDGNWPIEETAKSLSIAISQKQQGQEVNPLKEISFIRTTKTVDGNETSNWNGYDAYTDAADISNLTTYRTAIIDQETIQTFRQVHLADNAIRNEDMRTWRAPDQARNLFQGIKKQAAGLLKLIFAGKAIPNPDK